jgi:hypothetical protein
MLQAAALLTPHFAIISQKKKEKYNSSQIIDGCVFWFTLK